MTTPTNLLKGHINNGTFVKRPIERMGSMARITLSMQIFLLASLFFNCVDASGGIESYVAAGITYEGWHPYTSLSQTSIARPYSTYDPILDILSTSMSCNNNGAPGPNQLSATIPAGSQFTARYTLFRDVVGPVLVYMADCEGPCSARNSRELKWFKIGQTGYVGTPGGVALWGAGQVASTLQYTTTIPPNIVPGEYMIRNEIIVLPNARPSVAGPQLYIGCAQLVVTGGGTQKPTGSNLVSFPGAYKEGDPGIWWPNNTGAWPVPTTYRPPGPPVWNGQYQGSV